MARRTPHGSPKRLFSGRVAVTGNALRLPVFRPGGRRKNAPLILASLCLFLCASIHVPPVLPAESQSQPILLVNGAIYPWLYSDSDLPSAYRSGLPGKGERALYLLQCAQPIREYWLEEIRKRGGTPRGYLPYNTLVVAMDPAALSLVKGLDFISWHGLYQPYYKLSPALQLRLVQGGEVTALVQVFDSSLLDTLLETLHHLPLEVLAWGGDAYCGIVVLRLPADLLKDVAALPAVEWMDVCTGGTIPVSLVQSGDEYGGKAGEEGVFTEAVRSEELEKAAFSCAGMGSAAGTSLPGWLAGRVEEPVYLRAGGGSGGEAAGEAMLEVLLAGETVRDAAPRLRPLKVLPYVTGYGLGIPPLPVSMFSMLEDAYSRGARVFLGGSVPEGGESLVRYGIYSFQRDAFAWSRQDMLIVEAAGDEGTDADGDGRVDAGSLLGGSCAKNVISVGGCEGTGSGQEGGLSYRELARYFTGSFSASPLEEDASADDPRGMAAFSSRGPTDDGRIKPDLVAPATALPVPASGSGGPPGSVGMSEGGKTMGYGTGLAAAILAGEASVMRGEVRRRTGSEPSAALLRALLVNGAEDLHPGQYHGDDPEIPPAPNPVEGWGRPDHTWLEGQNWWIRLVDEREGLRVGDARVYRVDVGSLSELRVTLAWTDYPSLPQSRLHLVNDLDLRVIGPDGESYYPNGRSSRDPLNNTERVVVDVSSRPGTYTVEVRAWNVPFGPQPFALVVQGR